MLERFDLFDLDLFDLFDLFDLLDLFDLFDLSDLVNCTCSVLFIRLELHYMNVKPFWFKWAFIAWLDMLQFLFPPTLTLSGGFK